MGAACLIRAIAVGVVLQIQYTHAEAVDVKSLADDIQKSLDCHRNPGLAVAVVKDGKTVLSKGFGYTSLTSNNSVTSNTVFSLGSLTKAFTAALLVNAIAKNASVSLSSKVKDVVGGDFQFADKERTLYATIEDLLAHTLRVPGNNDFRFSTDIDRQELLKRVRYFSSNYEFRRGGSYSSTNYIMAAAITELISGRKWEDLMRDSIFKPLGMTSSNFAADVNFYSSDVASPVSTYEGNPMFNIDPSFTKGWNSRCGSGCIFSSADDMALWMNFHLSNGKTSKGQQLFPASQMEALHSPRTSLSTSSMREIRRPAFPVTYSADVYGLGWWLGFYRGYGTNFHTGATPGYSAMITLVPSENLGVFVAMNGDDEDNYYRLALQSYILDRMLDETPWLNESTVCSFPQPWARSSIPSPPTFSTSTQPSQPWQAYNGVYRNKGYGDIHVVYSTTSNALIARYGIGIWKLYPQQTPDEFYGKGLRPIEFFDISPFLFQTDPYTQRVTALIVKGFYQSIPPVFDLVPGQPDVNPVVIIGK